MKILQMTQLDNLSLINAASKLEASGYLAITDKHLTYLNISDEYIHQLFPLLQNTQIKKPDYFGENPVGAHISVVYLQENKIIPKEHLGKNIILKSKNCIMRNSVQKNITSLRLMHLLY